MEVVKSPKPKLQAALRAVRRQMRHIGRNAPKDEEANNG
jgi:hypothetical protein